MNSKDIASFRRQFKLDHDRLKIFDIFNVYVMKENSEIYHHECQPFAMLEREQQELFLDNFKKLLRGQMDEKLFELKFQREAEDSTQLILHKGLLADRVEAWKEEMLRIVGKMLKDTPFTQDTVITFIRGEYFKPTRKRNEETEESERDEVYALAFILCTINKTEQPQKTLVFDYISKEFKYHVAVDPVIKLASPEGGFLFPCFQDNAADVNHILYSTARAHDPDLYYIEEVLNGELQSTAQQDKAVFEEIVREVTGGELDTATLAHVYEEIHRLIEDNGQEDTPMLDVQTVGQVLTASGVEEANPENVERAFQDIADDAKHELKASSVMPKYTSKSIKINTKIATITISPQDLKYVRQVKYKGKRCILIEVDEDTVIEGFTMKVEDL